MIKSFFWFSVGVFLGLFLLASFILMYFQQAYRGVTYPGVFIGSVPVGEKTIGEIKTIFDKKNLEFSNAQITFTTGEDTATVSAKELNFGYNSDLLSKQAYSIGRSQDLISNISLILQAYMNGLQLEPAYRYADDRVDTILTPIMQKNRVEPVDALFAFENGRVSTFKPSSDGQEVDIETLKHTLNEKILEIASQPSTQIVLQIPIRTVKPAVTTDKANNLGIKELLASGTSLFEGSIESRIHNVNLAASRINGVLIAPDETFSFAKAVGDVSAFTGYKQAYVIQNGKTVLGDGGGVCQVSTTLFRAALNAGLPIVERHAHAYRVHYYEEDSPPGIDATVYVPSVDFKFKNDTGHYILIQTLIDLDAPRLTFFLYGTKDNREVTLSQPIITSQTPAPDPLYQDDPTLPKGTVKQVDFAAAGANVVFTREVKKDGKVVISDKFFSNFKPWQAIYLRGTKE